MGSRQAPATTRNVGGNQCCAQREKTFQVFASTEEAVIRTFPPDEIMIFELSFEHGVQEMVVKLRPQHFEVVSLSRAHFESVQLREVCGSLLCAPVAIS